MATKAELEAQVRQLTDSNNVLQSELDNALSRERGEHSQVKSWLYRMIAALTGQAVPAWEHRLEEVVSEAEAQRLTLTELGHKRTALEAEVQVLAQANTKEQLRQRLKADGYTDAEIRVLESK